MTLPYFIEILKDVYKNKINFIDIGAYKGSVTMLLLNEFPECSGILFEPTEENFCALEKIFENNKNIRISNSALANRVGETDFYLFEDSAQNSILLANQNDVECKKNKITVDTVDNFLESNSFLESVDFIKIDTQGNDLYVLQGAVKTIKKHSPIILTEFIFIPLYKNQGFYFDQLMFMNELDYRLIGIFNTHIIHNTLAFADLLFVHSSVYEKIIKDISFPSDYYCVDIQHLLEENRNLRKICEERLELINRITKEAEERLEIIAVLEKELKKMKG